MTTTVRTPLSRRRILTCALAYADEHGLGALSMHKLGAALGVKGMSLYNHVKSKDDVLDGVVELLWEEVADSITGGDDWRCRFRSFAYALRDTIRRHPRAANVIMTRGTVPAPALQGIKDQITAATAAGVDEEYAYALLRTITSYALGYALNEVTWEEGRTCGPATGRQLVPAGVSDDLARVAEIFCAQADNDAQFELALDLMLQQTR